MEQEEIFKYKKGIEAKDAITGFSGVITARIDYITGCKQYLIQPPVNKDGVIPDSQQFDENRIIPTGGEITLPTTPLKVRVDTKDKPEATGKGGPQKTIKSNTV